VGGFSKCAVGEMLEEGSGWVNGYISWNVMECSPRTRLVEVRYLNDF
jgi:hypothetical protein